MSFFLVSFYNSVVNREHPFNPYGTLGQEQQRTVETLINNLAVETGFDLMKKSIEDVQLGQHIIQYHPFSTWEYLLTTEALVIKLIEVNKKNGFPFNMLINLSKEGFAQALKERHERRSEAFPEGELLPYISSFAEKIKIPEQALRELIEKDDWHGLIETLFPKEEA